MGRFPLIHGVNSFLSGRGSLRLAQVLFYLNALIWLSFGLFSLARLRAAPSASPLALAVIAVLMAGNAAAMFIAGATLALRSRLAHAFALAVLLANILLTFTDQFGLFDLLTLLLDLILLILIVGLAIARNLPR